MRRQAATKILFPRPHTGQMPVWEDKHRFKVLDCGRRFGKTTIAIPYLSKPAIDLGMPVAWFAPTYKMMIEVWREFDQRLKPLITKSNASEHRLELSTGGVLEMWSLDNPDAARGRKYARIVVDEAAMIKDLETAWTKVLRPTLTDFKGDAMFASTPRGMNFFYTLFMRGQLEEYSDWKSWKLPTTANPFIDASEVEAARQELPRAVFEQEYLAEFLADAVNPFGIDAIRSSVRPLSKKPAVAFGIDLAKSVDWTVVIGLDEDGAVCVFERWQSDWKQTEQRIRRIIGDVPTRIDSTGVGDPIVENLQRDHPRVTGFKFTSQSKQQIMEGLAVAFQTGVVGIPDGIIVAECESFIFEYGRTGVKYTAPSGLHDDCVCALALAVDEYRVRKPNQFLFVEHEEKEDGLSHINLLAELEWE